MTNEYYAALAADDAFSDAIRAQFGPKATRYDHHKREYNAATRAAYDAKVLADEANAVASRRFATPTLEYLMRTYHDGMTKDERAAARGIVHYDTALPQAWVDETRAFVGGEPARHFVWSYDADRIFGAPAPIDEVGDAILRAGGR